MPELSSAAGWLPVIFLLLMALAMLLYVVLDGYDLGVGILLPGAASEAERDTMISAIGPFWDANETWLVLGVGILLTAFPLAHGLILTSLYLPVALMLAGLILRGVAFEFRAKARGHHKNVWDRAFFAGSLTTAVAQGAMLGLTIVGFTYGPAPIVFALAIGVGLAAGYTLLGAGWLIIKTEGALQLRALRWARTGLWLTALGIAAVSVATPLLSPRVFDKWFTPTIFPLLVPIPLATALLFFVAARSLARLPVRLQQANQYGAWIPFGAAVGIFFFAFYGLAYSLFPYLVVDRMTIWQAAAAPESLRFILIGAIVVLPVIVGYTAYVYRVFGGKARALDYG